MYYNGRSCCVFGLFPSPLENHVYRFLDYLVFWFALGTCHPGIFMSLFFVHLSTSSRPPSLFVPPNIRK